MEKLKAPDDLCVADVRSGHLGLQLDREYERMATLELHENVPEEIRSYWNVIRTLHLYGYFYYLFFSLLPLLAGSAAEMALRQRIPWRPRSELERRDRRGLGTLLRQAKGQGLLRGPDFPHLLPARERAAALSAALEQATGQKLFTERAPYIEQLVRSFPRVRNAFAHPKGHMIITPAMVSTTLVVTAELINALWARER